MAILADGIAATVYTLSLPYAGFEFAGAATIGAVDPGSSAEAAGLQGEDEVLSIDGRPFDLGTAYLRPGQASLRLTVQRDGQTIPLEIALRRATPREAIYTTSHLLIGLAFWIIAMAVLLLKPRDRVAHFFVLIALLSALAVVIWVFSALGLLWATLLMPATVSMLGPLFVHFHSVFPERSDLRLRKALLGGLYGIGLILLSLATVSRLMALSTQDGIRLPSFTPCIEAFFGLCVLLGLGLLVRTYQMTRSETSRRQVALNLPVSLAGQRLPPIDGKDLNRVLPGDPRGTMTYIIADYVQRELLPLCDAVVDLHSGGYSLRFVPYISMHYLEDPLLTDRTFTALQAFGAPVALIISEISGEGLLDYEVERMGKVFLCAELGGGGECSRPRP
jgi:hypothetical protein